MFDKKPVVVKPWEPDIDVSKEKVDRIPIWIRLKGLDIKYWGKNALTKISGMIGKPLKADRATTNKKRLAFAKVLVEVLINQTYPTQVIFENEMGKIVKQEVYYEWKPTLCPKCKNFGHELQDYRKLYKEEAELRGKQIKKEKQAVEGTEVSAKQTEKEKQAGEGTPKAGEGTSKERGHNKGENRARGIRKETNKGNVGQWDWLVWLLETKIKRAKAHSASFNLCDGWSFTTNLAKHPRGRIWLMWKPMIYEVDILRTIDQLIHSGVRHKGTGKRLYVTMGYAYNDMALRRNLWKEIVDIYNHTQGPWVVMRDFNSVLNKEDLIGSPVTMAEIRDFRQWVDTCCFQELKSTGAFYTWNNKQSEDDRVMSRIDKVLVNMEWMTQLPTLVVHYMTEGLMDHSPAIINWENENQRNNRPFKYFNMWSMDPEFKQKKWKLAGRMESKEQK
ncbi:uncharacterized protein LOC107777186 [Nicotiana tabacum]|uniref:uncharacterized protein LOC107777186 n=1 Tax=Nicotiana tabacum TaxID=4097 RepID=UPI003F4E73A0